MFKSHLTSRFYKIKLELKSPIVTKLMKLHVSYIAFDVYVWSLTMLCWIWADTNSGEWSATTKWVSWNSSVVFGNWSNKNWGDFWCSPCRHMADTNMGCYWYQFSKSCLYSNHRILSFFNLFRLSSSQYLPSSSGKHFFSLWENFHSNDFRVMWVTQFLR